MQEIRPRLEVKKEYNLGQCKGVYLGHMRENNLDLHVFSILGNEGKLYVLYEDKWVRESEGVIAHYLYAPILPKILHDKHIGEENSGLFKLIQKFGVEI